MTEHAPRPGREPEAHEWTDAALTFVPAILAAIVTRWALLSFADFPEQRAMLTAVGVGIAIGVVLERVIDRRRGRR